MKSIILLLALLSMSIAGNAQNWTFGISDGFSCTITVTDNVTGILKYSLRADQLRFETKATGTTDTLLTGFYIWDDERAVTWYSPLADPVSKSNEVLTTLFNLVSWRNECKQ